jgi:hypothetical protein
MLERNVNHHSNFKSPGAQRIALAAELSAHLFRNGGCANPHLAGFLHRPQVGGAGGSGTGDCGGAGMGPIGSSGTVPGRGGTSSGRGGGVGLEGGVAGLGLGSG